MQARITSVGLVIQPDPADGFVYPHHISRASLDALPSRPGIYIFRDDQERPLYIGKSVNIRSRVLSHLRTPAEARMLQQTSHVEFQRTAGEVGALLLESRLIKELQPLFNKKLRRSRQMCTLHLGAEGSCGTPEIVYARDHDFSRTEGLYGLFATRRAAMEKLREMVDAHRLCPALTGLETVSSGRPCFAYQIARCAGACVGAEPSSAHRDRLLAALDALRVIIWPYEGPVGIVEESDGWRQVHVVDHWFYLGSYEGTKARRGLNRSSRRSFDIDTYKILVQPLLEGALQVEPLGF